MVHVSIWTEHPLFGMQLDHAWMCMRQCIYCKSTICRGSLSPKMLHVSVKDILYSRKINIYGALCSGCSWFIYESLHQVSSWDVSLRCSGEECWFGRSEKRREACLSPCVVGSLLPDDALLHSNVLHTLDACPQILFTIPPLPPQFLWDCLQQGVQTGHGDVRKTILWWSLHRNVCQSDM